LKLDQMTPLEAMVLLDEMAKSIDDEN